MADIFTKQGCLDVLIDGYDFCYTYYYLSQAETEKAVVAFNAGDYVAAISFNIVAHQRMQSAITGLLNSWETADPSWALPYYLRHYTLWDYRSINESWFENNFRGAGPTIAFIDRMRQLLWDEPYFVAWAAIPEQKPEGP